MMNPASIEKHLYAIDNLLNSFNTSETDVKRHLKFIAAIPIFLFKIPAKTYVYRARTSFDNESFSQISNLSYPPTKESVKYYGRSNIPGQSLFYCSEDQGTALLELINYWVKNVIPGQIFQVTMGEWVTTENLESIIVTSPNIAKRKTEFERRTGNAYDIKIQELTTEQQIIAKLFYNKFYDWYSRPAGVGDSIYIVTSNISNKLISSGKRYKFFKNAAISYPSVENVLGGVNFAFEPKIVASGKLKLVRACRIKIMAKSDVNGKYNFKEINREYSIINEDNSLCWGTKCM